ncbi:hypothetical protein BDN72DRAFT_553865 [Pluteus cervinus]|uniref:Uncharacterized protein n=1 Tax=Pluteus cervinus TaxID=181527 RepID=A0ACD3A2T0_9AGAR|nr:hypothetical protein BDN72DRAFT_553865 [Pluteus cervinus]
MDMLQNPRACNLKVRRSNEFSRDTVYQRLKPLGLDFFPVSLPKHEQDHAFSRLFISSIYGGSVKGSRPAIGASFFDKTGLKDFLYLNLEHHLHAPQVPGAPGLYLSLTMSGKGPGIDISGVWIVFTRLASDEWGYMGLYELKLSQPLRKEEWLVQSEKVRHGWAKRILDNSWGISCRARIACRKAFGREPTNEEAGAGASGEYGSITHEDVVNALINGEETLNVWTMKCVGYDVGLQRNLIENVKTWVRPPPRFAGGKAATSVRGNRKGKKPQPMNGQ